MVAELPDALSLPSTDIVEATTNYYWCSRGHVWARPQLLPVFFADVVRNIRRRVHHIIIMSTATSSSDIFQNVAAAAAAADDVETRIDRRGQGLKVWHVLPVTDDGGSTAEIVRVLGGPAVGDIRSRLLRLAPGTTREARAVRRLLGHRLISYESLD